jgi:hypothetical protein
LQIYKIKQNNVEELIKKTTETEPFGNGKRKTENGKLQEGAD